jgi:hypothetical protein
VRRTRLSSLVVAALCAACGVPSAVSEATPDAFSTPDATHPSDDHAQDYDVGATYRQCAVRRNARTASTTTATV